MSTAYRTHVGLHVRAGKKLRPKQPMTTICVVDPAFQGHILLSNLVGNVAMPEIVQHVPHRLQPHGVLSCYDLLSQQTQRWSLHGTRDFIL